MSTRPHFGAEDVVGLLPPNYFVISCKYGHVAGWAR